MTGLVTHDAALSERLRCNGTPLHSNGDVEIARATSSLRSLAPSVIILIAGETSTPRLSRVFSAWANALRAVQEALNLRRRGYASVRIRQWRSGTVVASSDARPVRANLAFAGRSIAVMAGSRGQRSLLEAILAECSEESGRLIDARSFVSTRSGLMGIGTETVFRVGVGRTAQIVSRQIESLERLHRGLVERAPRGRTPRILAHGRHGDAVWSLEEKLHGARPGISSPSAPLVDDCVTFLADLYSVGGAAARPRSLEESAEEAISLACVESIGEELRELARQADAALGSVRSGFGHGDFWAGNTLVRDGRLVGVVDWSDAEPNSLPLVDLFHLLVSAKRMRHGDSWGGCVASWLVPRIERGEVPEAVDAYGEAVGLRFDARVLRDLLVAYWITQIHRQVSDFRGLIDLGQWGATNVEPVVLALS
jgi:hypothetical protein